MGIYTVIYLTPYVILFFGNLFELLDDVALHSGDDFFINVA